jgi:TonB family protein
MHTFERLLIAFAAIGGIHAVMAAPSIPMDRIISAKPPPDYPEQERLAHHTGSGVFRAYLDSKSGTVKTIKVEKSTGYPALDAAVMKAIVQWRFKPGFADSGPIPIEFHYGGR